MGYRDLGPNVSQKPQAVTPGGGQYTAEDHSFESLVFEQGKPPLDWEMNLMQEALGAYGFRRNNSRLLPSSWVVGGFLESSIPTSYAFLTPDPPGATTANQFMMVASDLVVNGWVLHYEFSGTPTAGFNIVQLPAPPSSGGRTDLVILEVWRALISPSPDGTNKSPTGQILRFGNAKAPDTVGNQNLLDDIKDPNLNAESARRVQIQYRYRVVQGITSLSSTPDGMEDPSVVAHTVPYRSASSVDGAATAYAFNKSQTDPGLWVAGTGSSSDATSLGTVDGFMHAVPVCAVFRRNTTAFNRSTNMNGAGLMATGVSGRPDGLYVDQVALGDVKDLRKSVAYDFKEVLDKAYNQVLDNTLGTEHEISTDGPSGITFLARDSIGTSGHIGNPDGVRSHFSDRSVTESVVVKVAVSAATVTVNLSSVATPWNSSGYSVESLAPLGTNIVGIGRARFVTASAEYDLLSASSPTHITNVSLTASPGPSVDNATITFNGAGPGTAYIELLIEYPGGNGIRRNMVQPNQFWTPPQASIAAWVDPTALAATSDSTRKALLTTFWWTDNAHREVSAKLPTTTQTFNTFWDGTAPATVYVPDLIVGPASVTYNSAGIPYTFSTSGYDFNASFTKVPLDPAHAPDAGTSATIVYNAVRPIPPVTAAPGDSYQLFYQTQAIQSVAVPSGVQTLQLVPRSVSPFMSVMSSGSGSPDDAFPFSSPSVQLPVGSQPALSYPESRLNMPTMMSVAGFGVNTGYIQLPVFVPYVPDPARVTLYKSTLDATVDGDGRNFWPKSDNGSSATYSPIMFSQELSFKQRHKVAYPVLMELKADFPSIGRKGTLVLVVFTRWSEFSEKNAIEFSPSPSDSCAAIFRVRGNMINPRRTI